MERKEFIKVCGGACLGLIGISFLTQSCKGTHYVQSSITNNMMPVAKNEFTVLKKDETNFRKYIVVKSDTLDFPIVVYRLNNGSYHAMLMRCSHQGIELSVNGDILSCSAHGSEFSKEGAVIQGPADQPLRSFIVSEDEKNIYIKIS